VTITDTVSSTISSFQDGTLTVHVRNFIV